MALLAAAIAGFLPGLKVTRGLYAADSDDPVLNTYRRIFSELIQPLEAMPPDLRDHLRHQLLDLPRDQLVPWLEEAEMRLRSGDWAAFGARLAKLRELFTDVAGDRAVPDPRD